jgi:hypothetical protein
MLNSLIPNRFLLLLISFHLLLNLIDSLEKSILSSFFLLFSLEFLYLVVELSLRVKILSSSVYNTRRAGSLGGTCRCGIHDDRNVQVSLLITRQSLVGLHCVHNLLHLRFRLSTDRDVAHGKSRIGSNKVFSCKGSVQELWLSAIFALLRILLSWLRSRLSLLWLRGWLGSITFLYVIFVCDYHLNLCIVV